MTARIALIACSLLACPAAYAQNVGVEAPEDPVEKLIREFHESRREAPNEVTVVLEPLSAPVADADTSPAEEPAAEEENPAKSAAEAEADETSTGETSDTEISDPLATTQGPLPSGFSVRIEKLREGSGDLDPAQVKLLAPFPAKPLAEPPAGWRIEATDDAPPFRREVELAPGRSIILTVRPHVLVAETDGQTTFRIAEPGFDPALGYHQNATVGAALSRSVRQLDDDARAIGNAIDNLQQLLVSLPRAEAPEAPAAKPANSR